MNIIPILEDPLEINLFYMLFSYSLKYINLGQMNWEFGISRCKLLCTEWINYKVLLYRTGNYVPYPVINHNGREYEKECVYVYMYVYN